MTLRDKRQAEFAKEWIQTGCNGILHLCPRFGKIRTSINIFNELKSKKILIAYPDETIKKSWSSDFNELKYKNDDITFTTHLSLKKYINEKYDIVVIDEIHLLSEAQINACKLLFENNTQILGLSGTLSTNTQVNLEKELGLFIVAEYSIDQAITEGVIADYQITVVKTPLDDTVEQLFSKKKKTEKKHFSSLSWMIDTFEQKGRNTMFLRLARMRLIQNSLAKVNLTKNLLNKFKDERILVFCGTTNIADNLGINSYHTKNKKASTVFEDFKSGKGNHLAVVKIGNSGTTYKPLSKVIINYFDSNGENLAQKINRCMAIEYDNADKKADIYIISSDEAVEKKWLDKALEFFDKSKIKYL